MKSFLSEKHYGHFKKTESIHFKMLTVIVSGVGIIGNFHFLLFCLSIYSPHFLHQICTTCVRKKKNYLKIHYLGSLEDGHHQSGTGKKTNFF